MNSQNIFKKASILIIIIAIGACKPAHEKLADEIFKGETVLYSDTNKRLNAEEANKVYLNYLKYVEKFPKDSLSPDFLFKAADLANGLRRHDESIKLFSRVIAEYPEFRKAPAALFMQAFVLETEINNKESAKEKYKEFLGKFPNHKLAASAQASLDQLNANLTDEELIKMFEEKNK